MDVDEALAYEEGLSEPSELEAVLAAEVRKLREQQGEQRAIIEMLMIERDELRRLLGEVS